MGRGTSRKKSGEAPGEEGFRVFRIDVNVQLREKLRELHRRICSRDPSLPRNIYYYIEEWLAVIAAIAATMVRRGKRRLMPRRLPPVFLLVKFVKDGVLLHGTSSAPAVIDLSRRELRIPCVGVRIPLKPSMIHALENELRLNPTPKFVLMLRHNGKLRLIAFRRPLPTDLRPPLRVIGIDINSRYGFTILAFDVTESSVKMVKPPTREMPPNDTLYLTMASVLRKISRGLPRTTPDDAEDAKRRLWALALERVERLEERAGTLTTERADRLRRQLEKSARMARQRWAQKLLRELRQLIREAGGRVVVAVDKPDPESLRNSDLQRTYLRVVRLIENLCRYEGALYREVRASGRACPLCSRWCEEVEHRYYSCARCNIVVDRDYGASFRAALKALPPVLAEELRKWLRAHPKALAPNFNNRPNGNKPGQSPASRDTLFGRSRGAARVKEGPLPGPAGPRPGWESPSGEALRRRALKGGGVGCRRGPPTSGGSRPHDTRPGYPTRRPEGGPPEA
ncbi:MAG: hypothetical protein QXM71_05650 [Thermofilum sp.]